jgi:WD40 repeat protein
LYAYGIAASPDGNRILLGAHSQTVKLLSLDGETPVDLPGAVAGGWGAAISPDGRFAAASGVAEDLKTRVIRVWNLASLEEVAVMDRSKFPFILRFTEDGRVLSGIPSGLLVWDPETGENEILFEGDGQVARFATASGDSHTVLLQVIENLGAPSRGRAVAADLATGATTPLVSHGEVVTAVAIDADGRVAVTGDEAGVIRVGPITGEEPHILLGNRNEVWDLAIDPRGRWIASASGTEVRLWPMPDLSKPPLHTLPHDELIARLKTLTNLRAVRDEESSTGWKIEVGPFPGWETVPTW